MAAPASPSAETCHSQPESAPPHTPPADAERALSEQQTSEPSSRSRETKGDGTALKTAADKISRLEVERDDCLRANEGLLRANW
eukprot:SAG31_NODE_17968_length_651_cov_1.099638_1_plen_83_part_01